MIRTVWIITKRDKCGNRVFLANRDTLAISDDYSDVVYFHSEDEAISFLKENKDVLKDFCVE